MGKKARRSIRKIRKWNVRLKGMHLERWVIEVWAHEHVHVHTIVET